MSKAKHIHAILRGHNYIIHQLHAPSTLAATAAASVSTTTAAAAASLRLLPSRLVVGPGCDSGSRSLHSHSHSRPQTSCPPPRSCQRHHSRARQRNHVCCLLHTSSSSSAVASPSASASLTAASSASTAHHGDDRHTSHASDSIQSSSSTGGTGGAGAGTRAKSDGNGASQGAAGQVAGDAGVGRVLEERTSSSSTLSATTGRWTSELPWIDPNTQSSRESGSSGGNSNTTHTNGSNSSSNNTKKTTTASFFDQPFQNTRHNYVFAHGASGFAKNPGKQPTLTPEEDRAYLSVQVGEDSYFRRHDALGVADGVGGWSGTTGANPALYSRKLMHYAFLELEKYDNIEEEAFYDYFNVNPVHILEKSYEQSARDAKKEGLIGSSTACLAILRDDELRIANLGDCGVSVIRRNEFIFRTEEQQHSFNYPFQLGTGSTDSPTDAQVFTVKVESGDIVVMGTDGIFDNLFDEDILEEVVKCVSGIDPHLQNQSPYGTGTVAFTGSGAGAGSGTGAGSGKSAAVAATTATILSSKGGVGGLWSGLTSGAAKLASTSTSTIAAIAGKTTPSTQESSSSSASSGKNISDTINDSYASLLNSSDDSESFSELSPIAAAAIAAAESTALPPSAALYTPLSAATVARRQQYGRRIPEPSVISDALAKRAKSVSEDTRHHGSPFQSRAMQEGLYYQGGKQDDMSVLVAIIKVAEDSPDRR